MKKKKLKFPWDISANGKLFVYTFGGRNMAGRADKPTASCLVLGLYFWLSSYGQMARNISSTWGLGRGGNISK
jgi:hypothetical protein